jgi:hypothetical protein
MPIHNLGYREWNGELESTSTRWIVVAEIGIRRAWQSAWLRRMMYLAWVPGVVMGFMIFLFEQSEKNDGSAQQILSNLTAVMLFSPGQSPEFRQRLIDSMTSTESSDERRHTFWSALLLGLYRRSQPLILIPMIGVIAPPLISQDFRSRAFLMYFSRPMSKGQYIAGKAATLILYLSMITLFPALTLFGVGVLLSPSVNVLLVTWDLVFRIFIVSAVIVIPCTFLALMLSSLTTESRFASFAWFAIWIFGFLAYSIVVPFSSPGDGSLMHCISLFHIFSDVAGWMLDPKLAVSGIETRLIVLGLITAISMAVIYRRVSAPMQI